MEDSSARNEGASRPSPSEPPPLSRAATDFSASGAGLDDADLSREGSDDESVDLEPRDGVSLSGSIKSLSQSALKTEAGDLAGEEETTGGSSSMPVQKRRRVTRACDEVGTPQLHSLLHCAMSFRLQFFSHCSMSFSVVARRSSATGSSHARIVRSTATVTRRFLLPPSPWPRGAQDLRTRPAG